MGRSHSRFMMLVFSLIVLLFFACRGVDYQGDDPYAKAVAIWQSNEAAVARAVAGIVINDEFEDACEFFDGVTGIEIRGDGSYLGWTPNEHTREDLEKIRDWYKRNGARLYWDPAEGKVKVAQ